MSKTLNWVATIGGVGLQVEPGVVVFQSFSIAFLSLAGLIQLIALGLYHFETKNKSPSTQLKHFYAKDWYLVWSLIHLCSNVFLVFSAISPLNVKEPIKPILVSLAFTFYFLSIWFCLWVQFIYFLKLREGVWLGMEQQNSSKGTTVIKGRPTVWQFCIWCADGGCCLGGWIAVHDVYGSQGRTIWISTCIIINVFIILIFSNISSTYVRKTIALREKQPSAIHHWLSGQRKITELKLVGRATYSCYSLTWFCGFRLILAAVPVFEDYGGDFGWFFTFAAVEFFLAIREFLLRRQQSQRDKKESEPNQDLDLEDHKGEQEQLRRQSRRQSRRHSQAPSLAQTHLTETLPTHSGALSQALELDDVGVLVPVGKPRLGRREYQYRSVDEHSIGQPAHLRKNNRRSTRSKRRNRDYSSSESDSSTTQIVSVQSKKHKYTKTQENEDNEDEDEETRIGVNSSYSESSSTGEEEELRRRLPLIRDRCLRRQR